jgi:hypothetical protein
MDHSQARTAMISASTHSPCHWSACRLVPSRTKPTCWDAHGARVECVDLQFHTVHADGVEGVREDQSGSLSAVTAPEDSRPDQGDPEHAGTVVGIQVVQDHLADVFTRGLVDYRQIELVVFARAGTSTGIRRDTYLIGYT